MNTFLNDDFLLDTQTARTLYHTYAAKMPIADYHCHIDPRDIWEDRRFENITQLWLGGDHYKWRLMRSNGVEEKYITGDASDYEKFEKFAQTLPRAIGNPMYHWCHLELKNYFGYTGVLSGQTAREVWELCNEKLKNDPAMSARGLILGSNVAMVGTTDDPCSDLMYHEKLAGEERFPVQVCPSFRPDPAVNLHKSGFAAYLKQLEQVTGRTISTVEDVRAALSDRIAFFDAHGCRSADHGLDYVMCREVSDQAATAAMNKARSGEALTVEEAEGYQTALLLHCAREYHKRGWVMQLHFSCVRNPNSRMLAQLGPDTGFDSIAVTDSCAATYRLMDALEREGSLPKTVLYSLNPADNEWIDTLLGAFQGSEVPGKIQHGSAWWFNDNKTGMTAQLTSLANLSVLGNFIGMLTDSRSLLSYARHEYFRRVLCALLGRWVENGEYPADLDTLGALVQDICFGNAKRYFNL
ncbi:MAG TPA: glucuronate isomerase [Candidatus Galloscillospira stercoripullorum]|nr:glucuronate isomerase [Candidatus Galloscillospira stercoripullorum]